MKVLWSSRHPMDREAEKALREDFSEFNLEIEHKEVVWPANKGECLDVANTLLASYDVLTGVWPCQAIEAFRVLDGARDLDVPVMSPVSVPETEPDLMRTRPFRFVRWAVLF